MARDITFDILARDRASSTFDNVGKSSDGLGKKLGSLGKAGALAAAAAVSAAAIGGIKFGADAIKSASDLNETINKNIAIFGEDASAINNWAADAARSMGLSENAAMSAASSFGDMFLQLGFGQAETMKMSKGVVQLSADLGSFNNLPTEDVSQRIAAAFRGEYDSLQALIPNINAARVEKEALAMTGKKNAKALNAEEKAAATLAIVQKDGARAMGDFKKTSGGLANQQKILRAEFDNVKASIGARLLPVAVKLGKWFLDEGLPAVRRFGGWLTGNLWPALEKGWKTIVPGLKTALGILTGGIDGGSFSWKKLGEIITGKVIPFMSKLISVYLPVLATNLRTAIEFVRILYGTFTTWRDVVGRVISFIVGKFGDMMGVWASVLRALGKVPGFGWAKDAAAKMQNAADKAHGISRAIAAIPNSKTVTVNVVSRVTSGRIPDGNGGRINVGQRAVGGPVVAGRPYIVGENEPELFIPEQSGRILNQKQMRAAAGRGSSRAVDGGGDQNVTVQLVLDGKVIQQSLLRIKRQGGVNLGLA